MGSSSEQVINTNSGSHQLRKLLLAKIGPGAAKCHKCGESAVWTKGRGVVSHGITVGRADGDKNNVAIDNLVPVCGKCVRLETAPRAIKEGETVHVRKNGRRERGVERTCQECQTVFTVSLSHSRIKSNLGRYCSGSCRSIAGNRVRWDRWRAENGK